MKYATLCELYDKLEHTSKRLEKTELMTAFLNTVKNEKDKSVIYLLKGRIYPDSDSRESGISEQLIIKALSKTSGTSAEQVTTQWKNIGDLGRVAEELIKKRKQKTFSQQELTVEKVITNLRKLPELTGKGTVDKKIDLIIELLTNATPLEAKYVIRTVLADLRTGTGDGVLRDAIVWTCFGKEDKEAYELVQQAYDTCTDFMQVLNEALKGKKALMETEITPGKPVKTMLFPKVTSISEGFEVVGKPAAIELKYDGFRMMINKEANGNVRVFTRRLDEVTHQFPEVADYVRKYVKADTFILDGEAVGYSPETKKYRPFQEISQRIKRKYDIEQIQKELPVEINIFDIVYYNGKSLLTEPFKNRRALLEKIVREEKLKLVLAKQLITDDENKAQEFFNQARAAGHEGVMIKSLTAPYKPGARVGYGVKLKPEANELDLVIVKAEWGTGKRSGWLTSYTVACRNENNKLLEIGKVSTGLKEKKEEGVSFEEISEKLKPLIIKEEGREVTVKPDLVVTVTFQEVQKSPTYESGYALRFPRFTALRPDRSASDIATIKEVEKEYKKQGVKQEK